VFSLPRRLGLVCSFCVFCVFVCFVMSVLVQVIAWKDSSPKYSHTCIFTCTAYWMLSIVVLIFLSDPVSFICLSSFSVCEQYYSISCALIYEIIWNG